MPHIGLHGTVFNDEWYDIMPVICLAPVRRGMIGGSSSVDWYLATHAGFNTGPFTWMGGGVPACM
jgi:hypothetical protein